MGLRCHPTYTYKAHNFSSPTYSTPARRQRPSVAFPTLVPLCSTWTLTLWKRCPHHLHHHHSRISLHTQIRVRDATIPSRLGVTSVSRKLIHHRCIPLSRPMFSQQGTTHSLSLPRRHALQTSGILPSPDLSHLHRQPARYHEASRIRTCYGLPPWVVAGTGITMNWAWYVKTPAISRWGQPMAA